MAPRRTCRRRGRHGDSAAGRVLVSDDGDRHDDCTASPRTHCPHPDRGSGDSDLESVDVTRPRTGGEGNAEVASGVGGRQVVQNRRAAIGDGWFPRNGCPADSGNGSRMDCGGRPGCRNRGRCFGRHGHGPESDREQGTGHHSHQSGSSHRAPCLSAGNCSVLPALDEPRPSRKRSLQLSYQDRERYLDKAERGRAEARKPGGTGMVPPGFVLCSELPALLRARSRRAEAGRSRRPRCPPGLPCRPRTGGGCGRVRNSHLRTGAREGEAQIGVVRTPAGAGRSAGGELCDQSPGVFGSFLLREVSGVRDQRLVEVSQSC